ncbi:alpha-galactosidase-like protein [Paenibacillus taihuensis]|uniref:Alpha-galactosidase-like protein n=1 Tax=Paenibacillus taihuensis TaxID=1156355 RepID=A0A3D9S7F3_9BACL|nr:NEW3 domain-containing protein [Paenibacillus taihuensis]REE89100.1 alpha-galactosidase-like protein [Paenibacillus taihuensis]
MRQACSKPLFKMLFALILVLGVSIAGITDAKPVAAASAVELYTPYLQLSAPPGDSITYAIDVINHGSSTETVDLSFDSLGNKWDYELTAGGRAVSRLAVKAGDTQSVNLQLNVPLEVNKGVYRFAVKADGASLPIAVDVSEQGTFRTELTTDQPNMQGHPDSTFTYSATLRNRTASKQTYGLSAQAEPGWDVTFTDGANSVTSVDVDAGGEKTISIAVKPPETVKKGTYQIPISAMNNSTSADLTVEAAVTGTYGLTLSTPNDLLSTDVTAGSQRTVDLTVTNTGSADLKGINLTADTPSGWEVSFEPATLDTIAAGQTTQVKAIIKSDKKALAGDYVVNLTASGVEKTASAQFRVAVKTSVLWGWVGILIIIIVAAGIYFLFRKYGRR